LRFLQGTESNFSTLVQVL